MWWTWSSEKSAMPPFLLIPAFHPRDSAMTTFPSSPCFTTKTPDEGLVQQDVFATRLVPRCSCPSPEAHASSRPPAVREIHAELVAGSLGSVKIGCISNNSYLSKTTLFHWTMIMGERVAGSSLRPDEMSRRKKTVDTKGWLRQQQKRDGLQSSSSCDTSYTPQKMHFLWSFQYKFTKICFWFHTCRGTV